MTTIAATALPVADSWSISVGSGWITLMLIGMGLCFLFMVGAMSLMRGGRGRGMCGRWWPQEPERRDASADARVTNAEPGLDPPTSEAAR